MLREKKNSERKSLKAKGEREREVCFMLVFFLFCFGDNTSDILDQGELSGIHLSVTVRLFGLLFLFFSRYSEWF